MTLNRRNFLVLLGSSISTATLGSYQAFAQDLSKPVNLNTSKAFVLEPLPYNYNALEPYIDERTMQFHHDKHHAAYVNNLNAAIGKYPQLKTMTVEQMLKDLNSIPADIRTIVRNNGGGHLNHSMFWKIMKPNGGGEPTGEIATAIQENFGSFDAFKEQFNQTGIKLFGSGWVWLVLTKDGKLQITSTPNQDSPLIDGNYPIMGNDVWEHAYYLSYQNRRPDYLKSWWNVVNWEEINSRFKAAKA